MKRFLLAVLFLVSGAADAAYPDKPITMIVAYSPGGGTDLIARAIAPYLEKYLGGGARIVIVHRPGAGGEIGFAALANAPADGYTIGFVNTPPLMTIPIERTAQFGGPQRFELLGNVIDDPCNFAVHADSADPQPQGPRRLRARQSRQGDGRLDRHRLRRPPGDADVRARRRREDDARAVQGLGRRAHRAAVEIDHRRRDEHRRGAAVDQGGAPMRNIGQFSPARTNLAPDLPTGARAGLRHRALVAARHGRAARACRRRSATAW